MDSDEVSDERGSEQQQPRSLREEIREAAQIILHERMEQRRGRPYEDYPQHKLEQYYQVLHEQHLEDHHRIDEDFNGQRRQPEYLAKMRANKIEDRDIRAAIQASLESSDQDSHAKTIVQASSRYSNVEKLHQSSSSSSSGISDHGGNKPYKYVDMAPIMYSESGDARLEAFRAARDATSALYDAAIRTRSAALRAAERFPPSERTLLEAKDSDGNVEMTNAALSAVEEKPDNDVDIPDLVRESSHPN